ncbi:hypothetical protein L873DRAFT_1788935 [Choiromyces venosus 120613-1]|uniref:Uncharacterized protein n=1 Tax=Choiromyces venosus 120613-1 TaxID=1336337 RepID=A0A3N4JU50_9PEZI|nr:hypothetical protein L873DRAFT_1788935 [Choiromyces venosus 120613-1]
MSLRNGQNSDGTGIGDSQYAATSQELLRRVRFSSPIASFAKIQEIPATDSGNFTPEQTEASPMPRNKKEKEKGPSNTLALLILTGDDGETTLDLSTPELIREYMRSSIALMTNIVVAILLTTLEDSLTKKMNEIENRIMTAIQEKGTREPTDRMCTPAQPRQAQPNPDPVAIQTTNSEGALQPQQQQQVQQQRQAQ